MPSRHFGIVFFFFFLQKQTVLDKIYIKYVASGSHSDSKKVLIMCKASIKAGSSLMQTTFSFQNPVSKIYYIIIHILAFQDAPFKSNHNSLTCN